MYNKLLLEQLQNYFGAETLPENISGFLKMVSEAYDQHEKDYGKLKCLIEASSGDMFENKYQQLFEKMVDGVYKSSHEGKFIEVNPALVKMLGYDSKEELMSIDIKSQLYFDEVDRDEAVYQDQIDGISIFRLRKKDGSEIWVEDRGQYVYDKAGNVLYHEGFLRDVTERKRAEEKNRNNEKRFRSLIENNEDAIVLLNKDSGIIYQSPSVERMLGFSLEERCTKTGIENIHPDDTEEARKIFGEVLKNPFVAFPFQHRKQHKNGHYIWTEGIITNMLEDKSVGAMVANYHDVTKRKEYEETLEKSNRELTKANEELDKFVYSVSHDLRAPLSSMSGIIEIIGQESRDQFVLEHLEMINDSIRRLDGFIADILSYSRNSRMELRKEEIDFKEMLNDITSHLKYMSGINRQVDIILDIHEGKKFRSDKSRISMVLNNLISNAIRYQDPAVSDPFVNVKVNMSDTETNIIVKDNGIGISKENIEKIFEMFYRVSENSIGSGLGLYLVKEIVDKLEGKIEIESELGKGTVFSVHIPNSLSSN
jgi:PAS domain S-box-containing protein